MVLSFSAPTAMVAVLLHKCASAQRSVANWRKVRMHHSPIQETYHVHQE